jgi:hypothetical protein
VYLLSVKGSSVSDGYLFNDALTNALATQPRMRNDVIIMAVNSVKGSSSP